MKKITFYKSMSNGEFIKDTGYYFETQNGLDIVLHGGGRGRDWCATELHTGLSIPILGAKTLVTTIQQVEQIADAVLKFVANNEQAIKLVERRTKLNMLLA